ncbi:MAG: TIGR04219 family outer membrane beta-barrel protein [Desulfurivibrionaceae bacterium]|nr:TIGR04219 family outer membrane beta-barrel protein [Desulfurivibrionaceae bacterium]
MKIFTGILLGSGLLLFAATNAAAVGVEVAVGGWAQGLDGELSYKSPLIGDRVDLDREAGYDDEDRYFGRIKLDLPVLPNVYFLATPMEFEGDGNKNVKFKFGDAEIDANVPFYSKARLDHYDLALYYGVPLTGVASLGTLGIDLGINVRRLEIDMVVRDKAGLGKEDSVDETFYVPMGYLSVQLKPTDKLALEGELRGIAYSGNHYYDLIARLKYRFFGPAFGAIGWRYEDLSIDEDDVLADITISGPFVEGGLQF